MNLDAELLKLQDNPTPIPNKYFYVYILVHCKYIRYRYIQDISKLLIVHAWVSWHQRPCAILSTELPVLKTGLLFLTF